MSTPTTTAPAPAPAAAPATPAPAAPSTTADSSPFSALDTRARTLPTPKEKPETEEEPKSAEDDLKGVFDDKPADQKPAEKPAEAKPVVPPAKPQVEAPRVLRERLETTNRELETSRKELTTLREKVENYEKKGIDTTALTAKLEAREKEFNEIKAERDAANYAKSDDFKTKFEKPFNTAVGRAKEVVANLTVTEQDAEGNPVARKATWDDFADLYRMSPARAEVEGRRLFGDNYMVVMRHLDKLRELDGAKAEALQEYQANSTQRETAKAAEQAQQREKVNQAWEMTNQDIIKSNPDWYGERKDDEEGNALWKESLALVDQAYAGRDKLTFQQRVALDANIRLRAAAFPRILRENAQMKAQLAEIEQKRQQREDSLPGKVKKPSDGGQPAGELDWRADLHKTVGNEPG